jgi:hypothetical protein
MYRILFFPVVFASLLLFGCEDSTVDPQSTEPITLIHQQTSHTYAMTTPASLRHIDAWNLLPEGPQREAARAASDDHLIGMQRGLTQFVLFQERAEQTSQEDALAWLEGMVSEAASEDHAWMAEQFLGYSLIDAYLAKGDINVAAPSMWANHQLTKAEAAVLGFGVELLRRNSHHNADLTAATLQALQPHWKQARVSAAASDFAQAAHDYLAYEPSCEGCRSKQPNETTSTFVEQRSHEIRAGIEILEALAGR